MILDAELFFSASDGEAIVSTTAMSKVIDLGQPGNAVGGHELALYVRCTATGAATSSTAITAQFKLQTSADNSTWEDVVLSPAKAMTPANLAGNFFRVKMVDGFKRYLRVVPIASGTVPTGVKFASFMTKEQ